MMYSVQVLLERAANNELCSPATDLCRATKNIAMCPLRKSTSDDQRQMNNKRPKLGHIKNMCLQTQSLFRVLIQNVILVCMSRID